MFRVGMIGVGRTAGGHARAVQAYPDGVVSAVAEVDEAKGRAFAAECGACWCGDVEALLLRPDVDAVVVTLPNFLHAEAVLSAVGAGKHVLCEKPLATDTAACARIVRAAQRAGVCVGVAHHYHFTAATRAARAVLAAGDLGRPVMAMDVWHKSFYDPPQRPAWFLDAARGGGMWQMNGSHLVDRLMYTTGLRVVRVLARVGNPFWGHDAPDAAHAFLTFEGGFTAAVAHAGWRDGVGRFETEFVCVGGMLRVTATEVAVGRGGVWQPVELPPADTFRDQFAAFARACQGGGEAPVSAAWGRDVVAVLEACEESSRLGREVDVADVLRRAEEAVGAVGSRTV